MRVFSWAFWRTFFLKADDALARAMPHVAFPVPRLQPHVATEVVAPPVAPAAPTDVTAAVSPAPPRPLAKQLAVQRHLTRIAKKKQRRTKPRPAAKKKPKPCAARRASTATNRPSSKRTAAAKRNAGKKRNIPRRHVWLSAKR